MSLPKQPSFVSADFGFLKKQASLTRSNIGVVATDLHTQRHMFEWSKALKELDTALGDMYGTFQVMTTVVLNDLNNTVGPRRKQYMKQISSRSSKGTATGATRSLSLNAATPSPLPEHPHRGKPRTWLLLAAGAASVVLALDKLGVVSLRK